MTDDPYTVTEAGCWQWTGYCDRNGYARMYDKNHPRGKRIDWAHRVYYRTYKGPIPERFEIDHTCENTRCVNPDHLDAVSKTEHARRTHDRLGTSDRQVEAARLRVLGLTYVEIAQHLDYMSRTGAALAVKAAVAKGFVSADDVPHRRTLDLADYDDICELYAMGIPQTEIGAWYGVDSSQVSRICARRTPGHGAA